MPSIMRNNVRYGSSFGGVSSEVVELTQNEYNALGDSVLTDNKTYFITDADDQYDASSVMYDNTESGLNATDTQSAIDELSGQVSEQNKNIICKKFELTPMASDMTISTQNCFYNPLTKIAHIMLEFTCTSSGIETVIAKVPDEAKPDGSFWGIAHKLNGNVLCGTVVSINAWGEIKQGMTNGLTSGLFEFEYFVS